MQWIFFSRAFIQLLSQAGSPEKQREWNSEDYPLLGVDEMAGNIVRWRGISLEGSTSAWFLVPLGVTGLGGRPKVVELRFDGNHVMLE
jgi:phosphatidylglycerophosphatase A